MALRDNMVSYWDFEETSGTRVDAHGNNDLADNNTVTYGTGKHGNAASFNRANSEYLSIADASQTGLDLTSHHTINMWVKRTSANWMGFYAHNIEDTAGGQLYYNASNQMQAIYDNGGFNVAYTFTVGTWYMLTMRYNSTTRLLSLYVNNTSVASVTLTANPANPTSPFYVGVSFWVSLQGYMDGLIDDMGVWSRALSDAEVTELYNSGNGLDYAGTASGTTYNQALTATADVSASLSRVATYVRTLTQTVTATKSISRTLTLLRTLTDTVTGTATIIAGSVYQKALSIVATATAEMTYESVVARLLTATAHATATIARVGAYSRVLSTTLASDVTITNLKSYYRTLSKTVAGTASVAKGFFYSKTLTATATAEALVTRGGLILNRALTVVVTAWVKLNDYFYREKYERQDDDYHIKY